MLFLTATRFLRGFIASDAVGSANRTLHVGHTAKEKPRKPLIYKAFESVLAVWTRRYFGFQNLSDLFIRMPLKPSDSNGFSASWWKEVQAYDKTWKPNVSTLVSTRIFHLLIAFHDFIVFHSNIQNQSFCDHLPPHYREPWKPIPIQ